jgi:uncharacterized protein
MSAAPGRPARSWRCAWLLIAVCLLLIKTTAFAQTPLPSLTQPVNDFANVIDASSRAELEQMIRGLQSASGDIVVIATVETIEPYGDIREYAVKLFENNGRGIGDRGKDNGLLIVVALRERRVWIEVGYGLEEWITDGFAGETSRAVMTPEFREGRYGRGIVLGTARVIGRIAQGRNVQVTGVQAPPASPARNRIRVSSEGWIILLIIIVFLLSRGGGGPRRGVRRWGSGGWSGWSSGVGPFGGGFGGRGGFGGGGFGGGGFGGGFGGFGGGRSGGGGGGGSW